MAATQFGHVEVKTTCWSLNRASEWVRKGIFVRFSLGCTKQQPSRFKVEAKPVSSASLELVPELASVSFCFFDQQLWREQRPVLRWAQNLAEAGCKTQLRLVWITLPTKTQWSPTLKTCFCSVKNKLMTINQQRMGSRIQQQWCLDCLPVPHFSITNRSTFKASKPAFGVWECSPNRQRKRHSQRLFSTSQQTVGVWVSPTGVYGSQSYWGSITVLNGVQKDQSTFKSWRNIAHRRRFRLSKILC